MKRAPLLFAATGLTLVAVLAGYWYGQKTQRPLPATSASAPAPDARKVLYWYDPMYPARKFDQPGKSPFMDMQLVPRYADESPDMPEGVRINPGMTQNLGIRTAPAQSGTLPRNVDAVGSLQADETRRVTVQSRVTGWLERLHVRAVNARALRGQTLAEIYSPELLAAQEEYLLLSGQTTTGADAALTSAARRRLAAMGLTSGQIAALDQTRRAQRTVAITAPQDGIVVELGLREGAQVTPGSMLFDLVDLTTIWAMAEAPEDQSDWIRAGTGASVSLAAYPGEIFQGNVDYIYPSVNSESHTVRVRIALQNPTGKLRPGMIARVQLQGRTGHAGVLVPSEALIRTGTRTVIVVSDDNARYRPTQVTTGAESAGQTEILSGLRAGERVVISGQFLIDSEANLQTGLARMGADAQTPAIHYAEGLIEAIDADKGTLRIAHGPFAGINMPAMTMAFPVERRELLEGIRTGQAVRFGIRQDANGRYAIVQMQSAKGGQP